ncbi:hypothetical protein [Staphylococcus phage vB_SauM-V1SA20]|nr:hypothetical protein [Staphylococcus phage vB_SauM-V1SA20]
MSLTTVLTYSPSKLNINWFSMLHQSFSFN